MSAVVPVLIAGGGPTGLATALELAHHGVRSVVVEPRTEVSWLRPRAKTTSARSMELFRRWGLASVIRDRAPLPVAWSDQAVFATGLIGREITRIGGCLGLDLTGDDRAAESGQQVAQPLVEEILREAVRASPVASLLTGWTVSALTEEPERVRVTLTGPGGTREMLARYAVGCDGARSVTRDAIGSRYQGSADARPNFSITFRAPGLARRVPYGPAVHYWVVRPGCAGLVGRLDLDNTWWCIAQGVSRETGEADPLRIVRDLAGADIDAEILATDPWSARMLLADRYGTGRVFLAGDAAHQNPPWGGHGFNTGIGDAVNIGWKLAAVLGGWGGSRLLASYQAERRPVAEQTIAVAAANMATLAPELADPALTGTSAEFAAVRPRVAAAIHRTKSAEFHSLGLVLGYTYAGSPVVAVGSGQRLRHRWLGPGDSRYDHLGREFTLTGDLTAPGAADFVKAAGEEGIPLDTAHDPGLPLTLVRPDQHTAWSGPGPGPDGARDILRLAAGRLRRWPTPSGSCPIGLIPGRPRPRPRPCPGGGPGPSPLPGCCWPIPGPDLVRGSVLRAGGGFRAAGRESFTVAGRLCGSRGFLGWSGGCWLGGRRPGRGCPEFAEYYRFAEDNPAHSMVIFREMVIFRVLVASGGAGGVHGVPVA
jgi:2-polyprenyl-6-methoxyphenol hydroxylase-like FAD-dependent oxidoreductase